MSGRFLFTNHIELVKQARERHQKLINFGVMPDKVTAEIRWLNKTYKNILTHDKEVCEKSHDKLDLEDELNLVANGLNFDACDSYYIAAMLDRYLCYNYIAVRDIKNMNEKRPAVPAVVDMTNYFKFQYETKAFMKRVSAYLEGLLDEMENNRIEYRNGTIKKTRFFDDSVPKIGFKILKLLKPLHTASMKDGSSEADNKMLELFDKVSHAFRHARRDTWDDKEAYASYVKDNLAILDAFSFTPLEAKPQNRYA